MTPDHINAAFELAGAFFTWSNARQLWLDREIKGVYWPTQAFFTLWGGWNLVFLSALGQWMSFVAGIVLVSGNIVWVALALIYRRPPRCAADTAGEGGT